jgi:hypothetical protein
VIEIRERLDAIVRRRNQIVREGDYERKERPRRANFIAQLVDASHAVV